MDFVIYPILGNFVVNRVGVSDPQWPPTPKLGSSAPPPTREHGTVVLFIMLYKVVLTFESVDEILKCDHSNESY